MDSSVSCYLLLEQGYEVIGLTLQVWDYTRNKWDKSAGCCSPMDFKDARRVADVLGIPHYTMNLEDEFEEKVVNNFITQYTKGYTPNPCIRCNYEIKWPYLLKRAGNLDTDYIATGHYARIVKNDLTNEYMLLKARDKKKDQSYFLYNLTQQDLARTLFPLGELSKPKVRKIAAEQGLPVSSKEDSQEICFIENNSYARFIEERVPDVKQPGVVMNTRGEKLGEHGGIHAYTIGQRKGLGVAVGKPMYVTTIDSETNTVTLGNDNELWKKGVLGTNVTWISGSAPSIPFKGEAKIRYRTDPVPMEITNVDNEGKVMVWFRQPQRAITPGQAVVFYKDDRVLGGAWIEKSMDT